MSAFEISAFEMDADSLWFAENPSRPGFRPPPGAVDAHCHVFGPGSRFPYAPERKYTPCDAPREKLRSLHEFLGFERRVIVQATCHSHDNSALCDTVISSGNLARGVASVPPDVSMEEFDRLDRSGIRGARFNFVKGLVDPRPQYEYGALAERIGPFAWHIVVYFEAADLEERYASLPGCR